ncbi:MAG: VRR-NUC domain-containing protein [Xanthobacteraceae bacterium]
MTRMRLAKKTRVTANGTKVITAKLVAAPELEWRLQAAAVRRLRDMPTYCATMPDGGALPRGAFTIAADFNAARRSAQEAVKAKATGIAAGEPDLRIYLFGGRPGLIEFKAERGRLSKEQIARHALLEALGYRVKVIRASTEWGCADAAEAVVWGWLGLASSVSAA